MSSIPAETIAVAKDGASPNRWAARIGLSVVVAMLIGCFGVLIAASRGATPAAQQSPAAVSAGVAGR